MFTVNKRIYALGACLAVGNLLLSCDKSDNNGNGGKNSLVELQHRSVTPALIKAKTGFENLQVYSLISSDDVLPQSPQYIFGGSADGAGLTKQGNNYLLLVNNEDNHALSRITLDETFKPVKGEYIMNSDGGQWRLCSATMVNKEEHGFGPLFLTCGESNVEASVHGIDPFATYTNPSSGHVLPALGHRSAENAVPLPKDVYPGKTVILIGEDDDAASGGQMFLYLANGTGNLTEGKQYMLRRKDQNPREMDMQVGSSYDVEFVEYTSSLTGAQVSELVDPQKIIKFGRVEDLDYRKGSVANNREIYFNVTGQDKTGVNADGSRTKYGRVYRLVLDAQDPLKGKLEVLLDGDDDNGPAKQFQNPDNICVTQNYVYIQEDSNTYGGEDHDAYIYQYNIGSKELKVVFELDHHRDAADASKYNVGGASKKGSWEYGALVDISDIIGVENTFTLCVQPHTWKGDHYKAVDGGNGTPLENQASEVLVIKGLPK